MARAVKQGRGRGGGGKSKKSMKERRRQEQFASSTVWGVHVVQDKNSKPMRTYSKTHVFGTILVCTTAVCKTSRCVDCPATMYTHWKINDAKQDGHMLSGSLQCYPVNRHPVHLEFFARLVGSTKQKVPLRDQIFGTMFCRGQIPLRCSPFPVSLLLRPLSAS